MRNSRLYQRVSKHEAVVQFLRYAIVGAFNVLMFFALFTVFLRLGFHAIAANASAFIFTSIVSFFLNKRWAFRDDRTHAMFRQYLMFLSMTAIGLGINTIAFTLFFHVLHEHGTPGKYISAILATPFSVVWNFTAYRLWTFKPAGIQAV